MEFGKCMLLRCLEINVNRLALILAILFVLAGCATGSALATGQVKTAIEDDSSIQILTTTPADAEDVAIVKASKKRKKRKYTRKRLTHMLGKRTQ